MRQRAEWRERHGWFRDENWDEPMLPRRFAESGCLACHHDVTDLESSPRFPDPPAPKLLAGYHLVRQLGCFGCHEISGVGPSGESIGPDMRLETSVARGSDSSPGTMRKVGPSLRDVASRLDMPFLTRWIANPADLRPVTRMPRLFGLHEHLDAASRDESARLEAIEVGAVAEWLRSVGEPVEPLAAPAGVTEPPSVERGRELLLTQGCLACHKHDDYPEATGTQAADLSRLAEKYTSPAVAGWLADWLRDPARHSPRTTMPNPLLETVVAPVEADEARMDKPSMPPRETDKPSMPPGDESKLGSGTGETPVAPARMDKPSMPPGETDKPSTAPGGESKLDSSTGETSVAPVGMARRSDPVADLVAYLLAPPVSESSGSTTTERPSLSEADLDRLMPADAPSRLSRDEKLDLMARQTIAKRGCFGCHDLPGFESAQPIGPALSDWGRKDRSLLAFGRIDELLAADGTAEQAKTDADTGFYLDAVRGRRREGFLWQKLREPRSFDYGQTDRKTFNEHLRMGRFTLSPSEREAIATFVLGLTARPPAVKYVHQPDAAGRAIVEGRKVLDRFACAECHIIEMDRWRFAYDPDEFDAPTAAEQFDFLIPRFSEKQLAASRQTGDRGLAHAEVVGMPRLDDQGRPALFEGDREDDRGEPLPMRAFTLWQPAAIDGRAWPVGGPDLLLYDDQITKQYPAWGGAATTLLYPAALARARAAGVNVTGL
ncbi:MAG: hypothetical protein GX621_07875, partial [Pirellulaceae bacterium]|nr:hypothetical protein [Pirellulaceae bacterium]